MNQIIVLSAGININGTIFPNNSLIFTNTGNIIEISLAANKRLLYTAPYSDFCNSSGVQYTSVQAVFNVLVQNNKQSTGGGGGSGDFMANGSVPMTGQLELVGDPAGPLNPVTKQLFDSTITSVQGGIEDETVDRENADIELQDNIDDEETARISADSFKEDKANKGAANGYVPLNASSLIESTYLPSYVDDILEFANLAAFPVTGETGKIYIALDTDKEYRWTGSVYRAISNGFIASTADVPPSTNRNYVTDAQLTVLGNTSGTNSGNETAASIATIHHGASAKTTLVDADEVTGQDSAASFSLIRTTWTSVKAFLKTYFDTYYQLIITSSTWGTFISGLANKTTVVAADKLVIMDSAAGNVAKSIFPAALKEIINTNATVGQVINETFNNLTNFTQTGSAFSASAGVLTVSNAPGAISFASYIRQTAYGNSDLEQSTMQTTFTVPTISATSFGVGLGYKSNGALFANSLTVCFLTDSTNRGKIAFYFNEATTGGVLGSSKITINSGDVTTIKVTQIKDRIVATWTNGTQTITETYVYMTSIGLINPTIATAIPNSYNYSIYALGGAYTLGAFTVANNHTKFPSYLMIADSIGKGYNGGINNRPMDIISRNYLYSSSVVANANVKIEEINVAEILAIAPVNIILALGTNNKGASDSDATVMSKLATLVSALTTAGYVVGTTLFIETLRPRITFDVTGVNVLIRSTYSAGFIEMYYPLWSGTSFTMDSKYAAYDGLHMTEFGSQKEADVIVQRLGLQPKTDVVSIYRNLQQTEQGNVGVGIGNTNIGRFPVDAYRVGTQGRFGSTYYSQTTGGLFITALGDASGLFSAGIDTVDNTNYVARSTTYGAIGFATGSIYFYAATGVTKDAGTAPAIVGRIDPTAKMYIGGNVAPTAVLHLKASSGAVNTAAIQCANGTREATARGGLLEYENNWYHTNNSLARFALGGLTL